jgi:hypothetical protein
MANVDRGEHRRGIVATTAVAQENPVSLTCSCGSTTALPVVTEPARVPSLMNTVQLLWRIVCGDVPAPLDTFFDMDDWTLTVMRAPAH